MGKASSGEYQVNNMQKSIYVCSVASFVAPIDVIGSRHLSTVPMSKTGLGHRHCWQTVCY